MAMMIVSNAKRVNMSLVVRCASIKMRSLHMISGILIFYQLKETSGRQYQILSTKAEYESFTDKIELNVSISRTSGLSVNLNFVEDFDELLNEVHLAADLNDDNDYDFDVVKRTVSSCKLFKDPTYEPVVQFLYKLFLQHGNFPTECPIKRGLYYIKDMKTDPKNLPELMSDKKALFTLKHLSMENKKMKLLAYFKVHFAVELVRTTSNGNGDKLPKRRRKPTRPRT